MSAVKNIVVIGASAAGHSLVTELTKQPIDPSFRIILIDRAKVAYWPPASLRASVVPGWEEKVFKPIAQNDFFTKGTQHVYLSTKVTQLGDGYVEVDGEFEGSSTIPFEVLAICTGASQIFPMRPRAGIPPETLVSEFKKYQEQIKNAQSVLVIGGGPTGIEMAGEIISRYPNKKVTILHKNPTLLDARFPLKLATSLEQKMKKHGVQLVLGDSHVIGPEFKTGAQDGTVTITTQNGKSLSTDFIFLAAGNVPNTELMQQFDRTAVETGGLIKVDEYLQVKSPHFTRGKVFAAGDCCNSPGWKSLMATQADIKTLVPNVLAYMKSSASAPSNFKKHAQGMRGLVVPIGEKDGAGFLTMPVLGNTTLPTFMVAAAKGKNLLLQYFEAAFPNKS